MLYKTFLEQLFCCEVATDVCNLYKCLIKCYIVHESEITTDNNNSDSDFLYLQYEWGNNTNSNVFIVAMTE